MNERIRELAEQAGYTKGHHDEYGRLTVMPEFNKEKFAELIVRECIDQVAGTKIVGQLSGDKFAGLTESANNKYKYWNNALVIATMNVIDHFGIQE